MQNDSSKDFDLIVRSKLEDAGIKPSRRVWRAVSSRLDAAETASAAPAVWYRWAAPALAAAAVAAAVFFSGTGNKAIQTSQYTSGQIVAQAVGSPTDGVPDHAATEQENIQEPAVKVPAAGRPVPAAASVQKAEPAATESPAAAAQAEEAPVSDAVSSGTENAETKQAATARRQKETQRSSGSDVWDDPFTGTPSGRSSGRKASLYAQGSLGGNESNINFRHGIASMAPGADGTGISEQSTSTYGVPVSFGLGVRFYVAKRLSIGTGLDYSILTRTFTGKFSDVSGSVLHTMHYIGVPVNLYYDVIGTDKVKFYVYGGAEAEYCLSNSYTLFASPNIVKRSPVSRPQFSVGAGLGVEFRLSDRLGLYLDPSARYYFQCSQPKNIRTDKPFMADFDAGLRFNF